MLMLGIDMMIAEHGWAVQAIGPSEEGDIPWAFTLGLNDKGFPELFIVGLPISEMHVILNHAAKMVTGGVLPVHGDTLDNLLANDYQFAAVEVEDPLDGDWFNIAKSRMTKALYILQLVWPEHDGKWRERKDQPILGKKWWDV